MSVYKITINVVGIPLDMDVYEDADGLLDIWRVDVMGKDVSDGFDEDAFLWGYEEYLYDAVAEAKQAIIDEQKDMERKYGK